MMRLLTATERTQGQRDNDFHWCIEGELVIPPPQVCELDRSDPDGGCGCGRAFAGLSSHRATTTAIVSEIEGFSRYDLFDAIRSSLEQQGWATDEAGDLTDVMVELAAEHPIGTVLEHRLEHIAVRK
jgi:hypothetical protein